MKDIYQLKDEFDKIGKSDYLAMIKFYESNIVYINNIDIKIDSHHYDSKMRLQSEYGLCLVNAGYYSPAIPILESSIKMFENSPTIDSDKLYTFTYFEQLLWNYGLALWETKKVSEANLLFERLVEHFPKNEKYRTWLNGLKVERIKKISTPLWIVCSLWVIGEWTFFNQLDKNLHFFISLIGIGIFVGVLAAELYVYLTKKKKIST